MFAKDDFVIYGMHGVCRVIGTEKQIVNRKATEYLVLEPMAQTESRYFVPVANPVAMGKLNAVLSADALEELLASDLVREDVWIKEENLRKQHYRDLISGGNRVSVMQMVTSLYRYRDIQSASGRKFHQSDENFLRDAEKLLASEIALVMNLPQDEAREYLRKKLEVG